MHTMGIDIGTTTISVVLLDVDSGDLIGRRTVEHRVFCKGASPENRVQDPERILALTSDAMQELMEMHGKPCGIGLTGQMYGMRRPVTDLRRIIICSRRNGYRRQQ